MALTEIRVSKNRMILLHFSENCRLTEIITVVWTVHLF